MHVALSIEIPEHSLHSREHAWGVLDKACEDELKASVLELGHDAEGLSATPQTRCRLLYRDAQHSVESYACFAGMCKRKPRERPRGGQA